MTTATPVDPARECARGLAPAGEAERVPLQELRGRRLAADLVAHLDLPEAPVSAMDGWAVRAVDTPGALRTAGESAAGSPAGIDLGAGQAVRISTGARLPAGADAVVRLEDVRTDDGLVTVPAVPAGHDVRAAGCEFRAGALVLPAGTTLSAHDVGLIAGLGHADAACARRVRVAVVASGDELVAPGTPHRPGMVWDSNRPMLDALIRAAGACVHGSVRVADDPDAVRGAIRDALTSGADVVMTLGGASVGPHDHVRRVLAQLGAVADVDGLRLRPGRPTWLGRVDGVPVLALPGNPGAALAVFCLVGRPLLGCDDAWPPVPLAAPATPHPSWERLVRCTLTAEGLVPHEEGRSSSQGARRVDAVARLSPGDAPLPCGTPIPAFLVT
ncbi:MAG: molybdopterin molybdotransferase MoeA [Thermoleophilia bacterium]